jgi:hypothetical protein
LKERRVVKAIHSWIPISKRPTRRPKTRWEDDVKKGIQKVKVPNWKIFVQDRRRWKEWLRRPNLCTKSCRAVRKIMYGAHRLIVCGKIRRFLCLD